jgi:hypothetical protein
MKTHLNIEYSIIDTDNSDEEPSLYEIFLKEKKAAI